MRLKPGVRINGVQPEIVLAMMVAKGVWESHGYTYTCTSLTDGKHGANSLHYPGLAFDSRTWADSQGNQLSYEEKEVLALALKRQLGDDWDVVIEDTHIHTELDMG